MKEVRRERLMERERESERGSLVFTKYLWALFQSIFGVAKGRVHA